MPSSDHYPHGHQSCRDIRPGSNITIIDIDDEHNNIILRTSQGAMKSRPIGELDRIWTELNRTPAVHVDEVLNGSGSSRNQPETILANLPYIEWLQLKGASTFPGVQNNRTLIISELAYDYGAPGQFKSEPEAEARWISALSISLKFTVLVPSL